MEISLKDYLRENSDKTEADFAKLKALSDMDYYERDRSHYRETWKNISLDVMGDVLESDESSPEDEIMTMMLESELASKQKQKQELAALALSKLTETQRRRYLAYHLDGKTKGGIAALEGVAQQSINDIFRIVEISFQSAACHQNGGSASLTVATRQIGIMTLYRSGLEYSLCRGCNEKC